MPVFKILVVYYSRSGTTRLVATTLAAMLDSRIEEIIEERDRSGYFGYWRSIIEARYQRSAPILPTKTDLSSYDLVIVGTPVWAWSVASPVRTFLEANRGRLPDVAFFCTLGGAGSETVFAQMQAIVGKPPRATCAITARDAASGRRDARLADFVAALRSPATAGKVGTPS